MSLILRPTWWKYSSTDPFPRTGLGCSRWVPTLPFALTILTKSTIYEIGRTKTWKFGVYSSTDNTLFFLSLGPVVIRIRENA